MDHQSIISGWIVVRQRSKGLDLAMFLMHCLGAQKIMDGTVSFEAIGITHGQERKGIKQVPKEYLEMS